MKSKFKNVKISEKHHEILKNHCEKNGLKIYKILEKWIDDHCKTGNIKKKDLYDED